MQLVPYVFFYGRCEEALEFYKSALGGTYEMMRNGDSPVRESIAPGSENRIMHASFTGDGFSFFCSDGRETKTIDPDAGNITLALAAENAAAGESRFNALAAGGTVLQPFGDAFWGGKFGSLIDRFGNEWMVTAP
jgi:PhnB protein